MNKCMEWVELRCAFMQLAGGFHWSVLRSPRDAVEAVQYHAISTNTRDYIWKVSHIKWKLFNVQII